MVVTHKKPGIGRVIWHLTNRCNLRCSYGYVSAGTFQEKLSRDDARRVADQNKRFRLYN
jgi:MoaA/NifB/PqqE/SkfB family radical SAM enzyme